jgi:PAS domain S-box-containing protein
MLNSSGDPPSQVERPDESAEVTELLGNNTPVSVEVALRESHERYQAFITQSSEGIWRFEAEQPICITLPVEAQIEQLYQHVYLAECNDAMARMYGLPSAQDILGARLGDLLVREDEKNIAFLSAFIASGYRIVDAESVEIDMQGKPRYFLNNFLGTLENGTLLRAWGTQREITERKEAENTLRQSEERFRLLVENAADAFLLVAEDQAVIDVNQTACDMLGYSREELLGLRLSDIQAQHSPQEVQALLEKMSLVPRLTVEKTYQRKDGTTFPVEVHMSSFEADGQRLVLTLARDTTERKRLQSQVIQSEKLSALGELVAGVAHELNNPLAAISGSAQLLAMHSDPMVKEDGSRIRRMTDRAGRIVRSLLTFARGDDGEYRPVTLQSIVEATLEMCNYKLRKAEVEVDLQLAAETLYVRGNDNQLQQVLLNLITNAEHALRQKPTEERRITIKAEKALREDGAWNRLSVTDNGCGIPVEVQRRIFDPFYTTKKVGEGTGLGLSICHGIMEKHGGKILVESEIGVGTTFALTFPSLEDTERAG